MTDLPQAVAPTYSEDHFHMLHEFTDLLIQVTDEMKYRGSATDGYKLLHEEARMVLANIRMLLNPVMVVTSSGGDWHAITEEIAQRRDEEIRKAR